MGIELKIKCPNLKKKLEAKIPKLNLFIAAQMQTNRGLLFDAEGARNGNPKWKGLAFRNGMILSKRGVLRKSIAPYQADGKPGVGGIVRVSGETITIGTNLYYAAMMNYGTTKLPGGVLRPKNAKALMIPLPSGKTAQESVKTVSGKKRVEKKDGKGKQNVIFRKSVKIPARPFNNWTEGDEQELTIALRNKVVEVLGGRKN